MSSRERREIREHTAKVAAMEEQVASLETKNAKLREERDMYRDLVGCMVHPDIPDQLYAENAKLRELVLDMYKAFMHGNCYRWCEFKEPCNYISDGKCQWYDRMRELGVEVDA